MNEREKKLYYIYLTTSNELEKDELREEGYHFEVIEAVSLHDAIFNQMDSYAWKNITSVFCVQDEKHYTNINIMYEIKHD